MSGRFWHPFSDMAAVAGRERVIVRGEGVWLWDDRGRRYLDATSSLWYANIGHGRERMAQAIAEQVRTLDAYMTFGDYTNPPAERLADRLAEHAPVPDARVFLTTGGGDAIETAAKLARRYWALRGKPERTHLIGRSDGFHGTFGFGTSVGGIDLNRAGMGPLVADSSLVEHDSLAALDDRLATVGPERVAAFFAEPVLGAGGVVHPPEGYLEGVSARCAEHGILLVIDSVICAFGRLGTWFGIERWPQVRPDMVTFAKGVTSGYLPLGGVLIAGEIAEPFWTGPGGAAFRQGATYAGHPTCCAAALANLDILEEDGLIDRGRALEAELANALAPLAEHPLVAEVRAGLGVMAAIELEDPALVPAVASAARERGILTRPLLRSIAVSPPLISGTEELALIRDGIAAALAAASTAVALG